MPERVAISSCQLVRPTVGSIITKRSDAGSHLYSIEPNPTKSTRSRNDCVNSSRPRTSFAAVQYAVLPTPGGGACELAAGEHRRFCAAFAIEKAEVNGIVRAFDTLLNDHVPGNLMQFLTRALGALPIIRDHYARRAPT